MANTHNRNFYNTSKKYGIHYRCKLKSSHKTNKKPNQAQNYKKDYNKWIMEITSV